MPVKKIVVDRYLSNSLYLNQLDSRYNHFNGHLMSSTNKFIKLYIVSSPECH